MLWFDAHLDLAYMALSGRNMDAADPATAGGGDPPGGITLPSLREGNVAGMLATIFIEPDGKDAAYAYRAGDPESARAAALKQTAIYHTWAREGRCTLIKRPSLEGRGRGRGLSAPVNSLEGRGLSDTLTQDSPPTRTTTSGRAEGPGSNKLALTGGFDAAPARPALGILMEGADQIRDAADVQFWAEQGVVAIGLAWAKGTRHAGGNMNTDPLADSGREICRAAQELGIILDLTHLSDRALESVLECTTGPVIASHSNCRALVDEPGGEVRQRHLTDDVIREIARRGGMIGVNIFSPFILRGARRDRRATIKEWVAHVERICELAGHRRCVGLGSDADGGFSALTQPEGVNRPAHYALLADGLRDAGWDDENVHAFAWDNWAAFWGISPQKSPR